jgi:hypothetical protein
MQSATSAAVSQDVRQVTARTEVSAHTASQDADVRAEVRMASAIEDREQSKKETGASLMFIGLAIWVADALVLFFLPASLKMGGRFTWLTSIAVLALMGLTLLIVGFVMRGKAEE